RIWRDVSFVYIAILAIVVILSYGFGAGGASATGAVTVTQILTLLMGILAMNWAFYERENLWIVLTTAKPPGAYFRGLMLSFAAISLVATTGYIAFLSATRSVRLPIESPAPPIAARIASAFVATALLTRITVTPSAFRFAVLGLFS